MTVKNSTELNLKSGKRMSDDELSKVIGGKKKKKQSPLAMIKGFFDSMYIH